MNYVAQIEPRLTPHRPARPQSVADCLKEWATDLLEEANERLRLMSPDELLWSPHADANDAAVTFWHIARWLDFLATRSFPDGGDAAAELWRKDGWAAEYSYDPTGIGWLGLGTLTGYTPVEMRAVPRLDAAALASYLASCTEALRSAVAAHEDGILVPNQLTGLSPYQSISGTLQGSFGHLGEIDALVSLRARRDAID